MIILIIMLFMYLEHINKFIINFPILINMFGLKYLNPTN
jgi:hypothetical protein